MQTRGFYNVISKGFFESTDEEVCKSFWILEEEFLVIGCDSLVDLIDRFTGDACLFGSPVNEVKDWAFDSTCLFRTAQSLLPCLTLEGCLFPFMQANIIFKENRRVIASLFY